MTFAKLMSTPIGRAVRVIAGIALIAIGIALGGAGWILAVVGLVPLIAGLVNVCVLAPLFGGPFRVADTR
jgi:membrane-associated protease RseP (regulator of RpoE activity)